MYKECLLVLYSKELLFVVLHPFAPACLLFIFSFLCGTFVLVVLRYVILLHLAAHIKSSNLDLLDFCVLVFLCSNQVVLSLNLLLVILKSLVELQPLFQNIFDTHKLRCTVIRILCLFLHLNPSVDILFLLLISSLLCLELFGILRGDTLVVQLWLLQLGLWATAPWLTLNWDWCVDIWTRLMITLRSDWLDPLLQFANGSLIRIVWFLVSIMVQIWNWNVVNIWF